MKTSRSLSSLAFAGALLGVLTLGTFAGGCAETATRDSTGQYVDDTVITTKVKSALLADDSVKSFAIGVETMKGVVQLSGFVNTPEQKSAAGSVASGVRGVMTVHNNLIVK
jgi:osmotically-inducible protein OsmY